METITRSSLEVCRSTYLSLKQKRGEYLMNNDKFRPSSILSPRRQKMLENVVMILSHKSIKNKKEFLERYAFNKDAISDPQAHE